jgi:hypothetical protein
VCEGRGLWQRELALGLHLTQPPQQQPDAHAQRCGDLLDLRILGHES